jgi:hypothetical protein
MSLLFLEITCPTVQSLFFGQGKLFNVSGILSPSTSHGNLSATTSTCLRTTLTEMAAARQTLLATAIPTTLDTASILPALLATTIKPPLATAADHTISLDYTQCRLRIIQFSLRFLFRPSHPMLPKPISKVVTGLGKKSVG